MERFKLMRLQPIWGNRCNNELCETGLFPLSESAGHRSVILYFYHAATRTVESSSTRWFWIVGVSMFIRLWDLDQLVDNLI